MNRLVGYPAASESWLRSHYGDIHWVYVTFVVVQCSLLSGRIVEHKMLRWGYGRSGTQKHVSAQSNGQGNARHKVRFLQILRLLAIFSRTRYLPRSQKNHDFPQISPQPNNRRYAGRSDAGLVRHDQSAGLPLSPPTAPPLHCVHATASLAPIYRDCPLFVFHLRCTCILGGKEGQTRGKGPHLRATLPILANYLVAFGDRLFLF